MFTTEESMQKFQEESNSDPTPALSSQPKSSLDWRSSRFTGTNGLFRIHLSSAFENHLHF